MQCLYPVGPEYFCLIIDYRGGLLGGVRETPPGMTYLQPHGPVFQVHCLAQKIDSDCCLVLFVECIVDKAGDDAGLANVGVSTDDELVLCQGACPGDLVCKVVLVLPFALRCCFCR